MPNKLTISTPTERGLVMTRDFDAPRRLVWDAMTKPDLIRRWLFCPPGWQMTSCEEDVRVGGAYHWAWNGPDGKPAMSMRGVYREVVPPERLTRTEVFEFGCGGMSSEEQTMTMAFTERNGKTTVTISGEYTTKEARDAALASGMEQGVSAGYDNLETMLAAR